MRYRLIAAVLDFIIWIIILTAALCLIYNCAGCAQRRETINDIPYHGTQYTMDAIGPELPDVSDHQNRSGSERGFPYK